MNENRWPQDWKTLIPNPSIEWNDFAIISRFLISFLCFNITLFSEKKTLWKWLKGLKKYFHLENRFVHSVFMLFWFHNLQNFQRLFLLESWNHGSRRGKGFKFKLNLRSLHLKPFEVVEKNRKIFSFDMLIMLFHVRWTDTEKIHVNLAIKLCFDVVYL